MDIFFLQKSHQLGFSCIEISSMIRASCRLEIINGLNDDTFVQKSDQKLILRRLFRTENSRMMIYFKSNVGY